MTDGKIKDRIKKYRTINNLTQQSVADRLGIDRTTYSKYENGRATPPFYTIVKLARILNVTVEELCDSNNELKNNEFSDAGAGLTNDELRLLYSFRAISESRKNEILKTINRLVRDQEKENEKEVGKEIEAELSAEN
ncbi:MAG: helix-turn-helix domain-containing protein [Oscillospiraceae bacterium]|nr:helix-turn-helix domain-containing protein [Oscillospiraceae bacterium]